MKKRNRNRLILLGAGMLVFTLFMGYQVVTAGGPGFICDRDFHPRFSGRHFPSDGHKKFFIEHFTNKMDDCVDFLKLRDDQKVQFNELRESIKNSLLEGLNHRKQMFEELKQEINSENPDIHFIAEQIKEKINGMSGFFKENLDLFLEFYEILDKDQQKLLFDKIRERFDDKTREG